MRLPTILIYESAPRWVPELERQFLEEDVRIRACSRLSIVENRLEESPALALLHLDSGPQLEREIAELLQTLSRWMTANPSPAIILVMSPEVSPLEWTFRELGIHVVLEEPQTGATVARHCRRLLQQIL